MPAPSTKPEILAFSHIAATSIGSQGALTPASQKEFKGECAMRRVAIWIVLWGGLLAGTLYADRHKVSQDLADKLGQPDAFVDIVVRYNGDPSDAELAGWTAKGAKLKDHMTHPRTVTFQAPAGLIDTLSDNPNVAYISIDRPVMAQFDYAEQTVNAPVAWAQGLDGSGVGIALIDSGIASN